MATDVPPPVRPLKVMVTFLGAVDGDVGVSLPPHADAEIRINATQPRLNIRISAPDSATKVLTLSKSAGTDGPHSTLVRRSRWTVVPDD
jgi:hypothetical protein